MKIIGMCAANSLSLRAPTVILVFSALIHKGSLRQELCSVLDALDRYPGASNGIPAQSGFASDGQVFCLPISPLTSRFLFVVFKFNDAVRNFTLASFLCKPIHRLGC